MIPHKIHYCWFGSKEKGSAELQSIESWKKFFPDYEIKEWNESNFNINSFDYTKEAYAAGKFAFVSDVARLHALVTEGGIYFDTDVTVLKNFPHILFKYKAFAGFEMDKYVGTAVLASEPQHPFFKNQLTTYNNRHYNLILKNDETSNVSLITRALVSQGLIQNNSEQNIAGIQIFPQSVFCNKNYETQEYYISNESLTVHNFSGSWRFPSIVGRIWKKLHLPQTEICSKLAKLIRSINGHQ